MNDLLSFADRFVLGMAQTALCGGLLAGMAWLAGRWFPRMPHGWRAVMWWLVCARFVLGFACAGFVPSSSPLVVVVPPFWAARSLNTAVDLPRPAQTPPFPIPDAHTKPQSETASSPETKPDADAASRPFSFSLPLAVLFVWLGGFLIRAAISAAHYARLQKRVRAARILRGDETDAPARALLQATTNAARQGSRPAPTRLLLSPAPSDPLVTGWHRPAVLLSEADAARLSPEELTLVLLHEMAHLRRRDLLWGMVPHVALHLFWFWPLAHFACREWSLACEAACDGEAAQAARVTPHQYGELLLKLGTASPASPFFAALPVSVPFRLLQRRLVMLNSSFSTAPSSPRRHIISAIGTAALFAFALPLALLPLRFAAVASEPGGVAYTKINGDTGKSWADYPDAPRNLNLVNGLMDWQQGTPANPHYSIAVQEVKAPTAGPSLVLQAASAVKGEEGYLAQYARPNPFRGKRVRFSGWVKAEAAQGVDFWLRMDTLTWQKAWNKMNAPLSGNTDWTKMEYVFDVPSDAQGFSFGTYLAGSGKVWLHDPTFEMVDKSVPVSVPAFDSSPEAKVKKPDAHADRPSALDFDNPANLDFKNGLAGWWNDNPDHNAEQGYAISLDNRAARKPGENAAVLQSVTTKPESYGTLAQNTQAKKLLGKRVRFSTYLKTENAQAAGYWIVVHAGEKSTGFNRTNNPIKGTTAWTKYEAVVDIPRDAQGISFGTDLTGTGKVWTNGFTFEVLGDAKPVTSSGRNQYSGVNWSAAQAHPSNLDFAEGLTGWDKATPRSNAADYEMGLDAKVLRPGGKAAPAFIRAINASPNGYGALMQGTQAGSFRNHRIRFSGFIKTEAVHDARLWIRLDTKHGVSTWNMGKNPVKGTTEWTRIEFVLDVPADAEGMVYGLSLDGPGQAWADGFQFETVAPDMPVTLEPGG